MIQMTRDRRMSELEKGEEKSHTALPLCAFVIANMVYGVCLQEVHVHVNLPNQSTRSFELPLYLTLTDLVSLLILIRFESQKELKKHYEGLIVTYICQAVIGFLLNFWYIVSRNDSFAIGYFEPLALIGILVACAKADFSLKIVACSFLLTICAGFTSGDLRIFSSADRNGIIIFLVIYFISLRNLGLGLLHEESLTFRVRRSLFWPYIASVLVIGVIASSFHFKTWALPVVFSIIAMLANVAMFYLSAMLLEHFNLLCISVIGMVAQICVNLVCVPTEHAHNVIITVLAVCAIVAIIMTVFKYVAKTEPMVVAPSSMTHHEIYTRMEFAIFTGIVCGLLFYVFKPKLSERDLNNLHYVGLDNFVRKLLNLPHGHKK